MGIRGERSAQTRVRLLDAAVDCLVEYGYAGATTPRVAARAGLTRGAQVHHFGSKADLVVAAIDHLAHKQIEAAVADAGAPFDSADATTRVLDLIWQVHQGPLFVASTELWLAARTDPSLAAAFVKVQPSVRAAVRTTLAQTMPDAAQNREFLDFVNTAMDALRGILISGFIDQDVQRTRRRWQRVCTNLAAIAPDLRTG